MLLLLRLVLTLVAGAATWQAVSSNATMYEMVQGAYSVPLVGALVPLAMGMYWRRATTSGAVTSMVAGVATWLIVMYAAPEFAIPPQLCGLFASFVGMLIGSWATPPNPPAADPSAPAADPSETAADPSETAAVAT